MAKELSSNGQHDTQPKRSLVEQVVRLGLKAGLVQTGGNSEKIIETATKALTGSPTKTKQP